jgi:transcriptional regulator with XRE-family HTH domain
MPREQKALFPLETEHAKSLGERLRLARLRRRIPLVDMAGRVGVSRPTLVSLENGDAGVSLAILVRALSVLGLLEDLDVVARDDIVGRRLQDVRMSSPRRRK